VGIDKGYWWKKNPADKKPSTKVYSSIFEDGTFLFIHKPEETRHRIIDLKKINWKDFETYEQVYGRIIRKYLPQEIWNWHPHIDPEFETFTYGDPTKPKKSLLKLVEDDLLVFYAGFQPYQNTEYDEALYFVGYFTVKECIDFNKLSNKENEEYHRLYLNNFHLKKKLSTDNLVMVSGEPNKSKLLPKAILISQTKKDSLGRDYHVVSNEMMKQLGIEGKIQTSIPRLITNEGNIENLKRILGIN
jgi:hypothetical protein